MCKAKQQGGQRCFAHAAARFAAVCRQAGIEAYSAPCTVADDHRNRYKAALVDVASTPKGSKNLRAVLATWPPGHPVRRDLESVFREGVQQRDRRDAHYQQWRAANDLPSTRRDMCDQANWNVPEGAPRCPVCGQYLSPNDGHSCPPRLTMLPATAPATHPTRLPQTTTHTQPATLPMMVPLRYVTGSDFSRLAADMDHEEPGSDATTSYLDAFDYGDPTPHGTDTPPPAAQHAVLDMMQTHIDHANATGAPYLPCTRYLRSLAKHETVQDLTDEIRQLDPTISPADAEREANDAVATWANNYSHTEHGDNTLAAYHNAARLLANGDNPLGATSYIDGSYGAAVVVVAQYRLTQQWLADHNIKEVTVYRGLAFWNGHEELDPYFDAFRPPQPTVGHPRQHRWTPQWVPVDDIDTNGHATITATGDQPMSSYSDSYDVAHIFASNPERENGYILSTTVPAERIVSMPRTGMGCLTEREVVVLSGPGVWRIERIER